MLRDYVAFYPSLMDVCSVGDDIATAQAGDFYGGWITPEITGPFKGAQRERGLVSEVRLPVPNFEQENPSRQE